VVEIAAARPGDLEAVLELIEAAGLPSSGVVSSVVVTPAHRSTGLGQRLVERVLGANAPEALQRSTEFASVCPASAVCMFKRLW